MIYYRVKEWADGKPIYKYVGKNRQKIRQTMLYLIENELFTQRELNKMANCLSCFELVEIPKNKIHYSFGVRFEIGVYPPINGQKIIINEG